MRLPVLSVSWTISIATVFARFLECLTVVIWTHAHKTQNPYIAGTYKSVYIPKHVLKDILVKETPLMLNEMFFGGGMTTIVQCYAVRGLEVVAAQNISSTITNLFNITIQK